MRKLSKRILVLAASFVMLFAMSLSVFAAGETTELKSVTIQDNAAKKVSNATLYLNGDAVSGMGTPAGTERSTPIPQRMEYTLKLDGKVSGKTVNAVMTVSSKNRAVANAVVFDDGGTKKLRITAEGIGKTVVTVTAVDGTIKKTAKINVTVLSLVDSVTYNAPVEYDDFDGHPQVVLQQKGKVNLLAATNTNASSKTLTYTVLPNTSQVMVNGEWVDSVKYKKVGGSPVKITPTVQDPVLKVDGKGNVTWIDTKTSANKGLGVEQAAKATIRIAAKDQKFFKESSGTATVQTGVYVDVEVIVYPADFGSNDIIHITNMDVKNANAKPGKNNTYQDQIMYANASDSKHELSIVPAAYEKNAVQDNTLRGFLANLTGNYAKADGRNFVYTTSNAKVATVSADGKVTAVGNGKATISVIPAYGFTAPKASFTVNVQTKPETINASNDIKVMTGKKVKIGASLDKTINIPAADKKFIYLGTEDNTKNGATVELKGTATDGTEGVTIATVDKNGNIQGVRPGDTQAKVTLSGDSYFNKVVKTVNIEVFEPINKVSIQYENGTAIPAAGATIYRYDPAKHTQTPGEVAITTVAPQNVAIRASGEAAANAQYPATHKEDITFTSNKVNIAEAELVEDALEGYAVAKINPNGNGTAVITATALDGSKKKATTKVNVKTLIDEINVKNTYTPTAGTNAGKECLNVKAGVKTTLAITTNADATNKNKVSILTDTAPEGVVNRAQKTLTVPEGTSDFTITLKADEVAELGGYALEKEIVVHVGTKDNADYAEFELKTSLDPEDNYSVQKLDAGGNNVEALTMKKGASVTLNPVFTNNEIINRNVTYKATAGIKVKDGVITATTAGKDAVVTVTVPNTAITRTVKVRVVETDEDYAKTIDKKIKANLSAEDRSYLGAKVTFNEKARRFDVQITNPAKELTDASGTGLTDLVEDMVDFTTTGVWIGDWGKEKGYDFSREMGSNQVTLKIYKLAESGDVLLITQVLNGFADALDYMKDYMTTTEGYKTLGDLNGFEGDIQMWKYSLWDEDQYPGIGHSTSLSATEGYYVNMSVSSSDMKALVDARINEQLAALKNTTVLRDAGIQDILYNASTNTATIQIKDGFVQISTADTASARDAVKEAICAIFAETQWADVTVSIPDIEEETNHYDVQQAGNDLDAAIDKLFNKIREKVDGKGITEVGSFDGAVINARIALGVNNLAYEYNYTINFVRNAAAIDAQIDGRIAYEITNTLKPKDSGLSADYKAESNELIVKIDKPDYVIGNLAGTNFMTAMENVLNGVATGNSTASIRVDGKEKSFVMRDVPKSTLLDAFNIADTNTLNDLLLKDAVVAITYPQINGDVTLTYTITYILDEDKMDQAITEKINAALTNAKSVSDELITNDSSYSEEYRTLSIVLNAAKNEVNLIDTDAIYDVLKAAIPTGTDATGIKALEVTMISSKGKITIAADEEKFKEKIGNALLKLTGLEMNAKAVDLVGNDLKLIVSYGKEDADKNVSFDYIVSFRSSSPILSNVQSGEGTLTEEETTVEDITEEETTVEDATEEETTVEDATEETTVEETIEEDITIQEPVTETV